MHIHNAPAYYLGMKFGDSRRTNGQTREKERTNGGTNRCARETEQTKCKQRTQWTSKAETLSCDRVPLEKFDEHQIDASTLYRPQLNPYFECDLLHIFLTHFIVISSRFLSININSMENSGTNFSLPLKRVYAVYLEAAVRLKYK